ncbi:MAG: zinc ribbon domain-containing protein [Lachnospiraceae bacterium]|nr:zinc ribbon domain-containing protein [Lachnospiraceae bacterium]
MYCIKCGKEISDNSKFCRYCGTVIEDEDTDFDDNFTESSDAKSKKGRGTKALLAALIILLICLVIGGAGAGVYLFMQSRQDKAGIEQNNNGEEDAQNAGNGSDMPGKNDPNTEIISDESGEDEETGEEESSGAETSEAEEKGDISEEETSKSSSNSNEVFGIDADTAEDYENVLEFSEFERYKSKKGGGLFEFYYPLNLYNTVLKDTSISDSVYGENEEDIQFSGSEGSSLRYTVTSRIDDASLEEAAKYVYSYESDSIDEVSDIYPLKVDDDKGFFIITGRDKSDDKVLVYDMVRVEDSHIYQMLVTFPEFKDEEDEDRKSYYTECLYRSCGFSNSSKEVRSYEEYLASK